MILSSLCYCSTYGLGLAQSQVGGARLCAGTDSTSIDVCRESTIYLSPVLCCDLCEHDRVQILKASVHLQA